MMRNWIVAGTLLLVLSLAGCNNQKIMSLFVPTEQDKAAQAYLDDIRRGEFALVEDALDPALKPKLTADLMKQLQSLLAAEPIKSRTIVGSHVYKFPQFTKYDLAYEFALRTHWLLAQMVLQAANGRQTITGIHLTPMAQSLEQLNAFTLSKGVASLIFLGLAILVPIFVVWTAIVCWRTPIPRRKWLWRIFVLVGIMAINLNWTSGIFQFLPVQLQLLG